MSVSKGNQNWTITNHQIRLSSFSQDFCPIFTVPKTPEFYKKNLTEKLFQFCGLLLSSVEDIVLLCKTFLKMQMSSILSCHWVKDWMDEVFVIT